MEEIIKRLEILKLSISLKDIESIDLQMGKLEALNINQQVKNILALIKNGHNYKAVMSINAYPNELYTNEYYSKVKAEEEAVIEEFGLFENSSSGTPSLVVQHPVVEKIESEDDILEELKEEEAQLNRIEEEEKLETQEPKVIKNSWFVEEEPEKEEQKEDTKEENNNIEEELEEEIKEELEEEKNLEEEKELEEEIQEDDKIEKEAEENKDIKEDEDNDKIDLNDGLDDTNNYNSWYHDNTLENKLDDTNPHSYTKDYTFEEEEENQKKKESNTYDHDLIIEDDDLDDIAKDYYRQKIQEDKAKVVAPLEESGEEELQDDEGFYQAIQFLEQKFENIIKRFPQKEPIESELDSIKHLISMFEKPYRDEDVEIALKQFDEFKKNEELEEAGKILLLVSISDSKVAHFALSRELFKGDILEQNYPEAFIQMNDLALDGFVEAICDLGQFYEYGIGVKKDRKKAISLYEEAMELNLERAKELKDKLENSKKSFFSYLFD